MGRIALGSSSTAFFNCAIASSTFPARTAIARLENVPLPGPAAGSSPGCPRSAPPLPSFPPPRKSRPASSAPRSCPGSSSTVFWSSWKAVGKSLASRAAFASLNRSAASLGPAFTAFLYSITASLYFSFCAYSSPRLACLAASSAGVLEQEKRSDTARQETRNRPDRPFIATLRKAFSKSDRRGIYSRPQGRVERPPTRSGGKIGKAGRIQCPAFRIHKRIVSNVSFFSGFPPNRSCQGQEA